MDANGTHFHLLLGEGDWRRSAEDPADGDGPAVRWDGERGDLTLQPLAFRFPAGAGEVGPSDADRRGANSDAFDNRYWIGDDSAGIEVHSSATGSSRRFWDPGVGDAPGVIARGEFERAEPEAAAPTPARLSGLAITDDQFLVAGTVDPGGLLVFDLRGGGAPEQVLWPTDVAFEPHDMVARPGGGVYVLDAAARRYWELDRHLRVVSLGPRPDEPGPAGEFEPADGSEAESSAPEDLRPRIVEEDAAVVAGEAIAIESAPDGTVLVLDRAGGAHASQIRRYRDGVVAGDPARLEDGDLGLAVVAHDIALVPAPEPRADRLGRLYVADRAGDQSFAFELAVAEDDQLTARAVHEYYPMRSFGGRGLLVGRERALYDFAGGRWTPLVHLRRPRYRTDGRIVTPPFDGRSPGCVWHRLTLDACIPPDAEVRVESRAADEEENLKRTAWAREPGPYARGDGSELPFDRAANESGYATWELLFQGARGRHLQLRLTLIGDGRTSPRLRALRAWFPRFSYLERYLPGVYREDPVSASFLDRFLANLEGLATTLEDRIAAAQVLLDPRSAPPETLDWLAGFFEFALDPSWDERRRRLFIANAMEFFRWRGTLRGLELALRLALDPCAGRDAFYAPQRRRPVARIVERFRARSVPAALAGDPTAGPTIVEPGTRWQPAEGADLLHARWRAYLDEDDPNIEFPLEVPAGERESAWRQFSRRTLGFEPAGQAEQERWRTFLGRRYGRVEALNRAWGLAGSATFADITEVPYPESLPPDGEALLDWWQFEAVVVPSRRAAHRFTVLLPVPAGGHTQDGPTPEERRALARRVVGLQKPAHTSFDVRFFWAAFRIGEARLDEDTVIDRGSRSPELLRALVLGREHAGESHLGGAPPPVLGPRPTIGRGSRLQ